MTVNTIVSMTSAYLLMFISAESEVSIYAFIARCHTTTFAVFLSTFVSMLLFIAIGVLRVWIHMSLDWAIGSTITIITFTVIAAIAMMSMMGYVAPALATGWSFLFFGYPSVPRGTKRSTTLAYEEALKHLTHYRKDAKGERTIAVTYVRNMK